MPCVINISNVPGVINVSGLLHDGRGAWFLLSIAFKRLGTAQAELR